MEKKKVSSACEDFSLESNVLLSSNPLPIGAEHTPVLGLYFWTVLEGPL